MAYSVKSFLQINENHYSQWTRIKPINILSVQWFLRKPNWCLRRMFSVTYSIVWLCITFWIILETISRSRTGLKFLGSVLAVYMQGCIQWGFATGQLVQDPKFFSQINKKLKILVNLILIWMNSPLTQCLIQLISA